MDIHERLRKARQDAGYATATDAAEAFGWNKYTVISNENGNRAFGRDAAERYARAYKVSLDWLLTGRGKEDPETAEIIDILYRIPPENRDVAKRMLRSLTNDDDKSG